MKKPVIAVFFGSRSAEHDVSIITAISSIIKPLDLTKKYQVVAVYIAKDGRWFCDDELKEIELYSTGRINDWTAKHTPVAVQFDSGLKLLMPALKNKYLKVDIAFPATHGTHGEDGDLMGIFEMANVAYVGCGVEASAIAMDKITSKLLAQSHGVPITKFQYFTRSNYDNNKINWLKEIETRLMYPLFVKPTHLGSSIAITKVTNKNELENAIELAFYYDDKVLVEEGVNNLIEVTQPIIGNNELTLAFLEQPLLKENTVFDFESKYLNGGKGGKKMSGNSNQSSQGYSTLPAEIAKPLYDKAQEIAITTYRALSCSGIARIDMLIDSKSKKIYFNEINPLPGSLYAHNWRSLGISNVQLVERLVALALERFEERQKLTTTFTTNFLKQF
jgi:D-alanine-D-alanine ligase